MHADMCIPNLTNNPADREMPSSKRKAHMPKKIKYISILPSNKNSKETSNGLRKTLARSGQRGPEEKRYFESQQMGIERQ